MADKQSKEIQPTDKLVPEVKPETYNCSTCRTHLTETTYSKQYLGYKVVNGKSVASTDRFTIFCKTCGSFIVCIDTKENTSYSTVSPSASLGK